VEGVGPITLKRIQAYFGDLASAWAANAIDLQAVEGIGSKLATAIAQQRPNLDLTPPAVPFLTPADGAYPALLFEIPDPPPVLYYQGQLELLPQCQTQPAAAIVGTRSPSDYGRRWDPPHQCRPQPRRLDRGVWAGRWHRSRSPR
jgi:DNA processing protein